MTDTEYAAAWARAVMLDQADADFWTEEAGEPCS